MLTSSLGPPKLVEPVLGVTKSFVMCSLWLVSHRSVVTCHSVNPTMRQSANVDLFLTYEMTNIKCFCLTWIHTAVLPVVTLSTQVCLSSC